jgi:hypothetical protein
MTTTIPTTTGNSLVDHALALTGGRIMVRRGPRRRGQGHRPLFTFQWEGIDTRSIDVFAAVLRDAGWEPGGVFGPPSCAWQRIIAEAPRPSSTSKVEDTSLDEFGQPFAPWTDDRLEGAVAAAITDLSSGNPTAQDAVNRLGAAFAACGGYRDSIDREHAFTWASEATGIDYNSIFDAWLATDGWAT